VSLELVREGLGLCIVEIVGDDGVGDVGRGERPVLGAQVEQRFQRFGYSRGHADDFSQRTPSFLRGWTGARCAHLPSKSQNASKAGFIPVYPLRGKQNLVAKCYKDVRTAQPA